MEQNGKIEPLQLLYLHGLKWSHKLQYWERFGRENTIAWTWRQVSSILYLFPYDHVLVKNNVHFIFEANSVISWHSKDNFSKYRFNTRSSALLMISILQVYNISISGFLI